MRILKADAVWEESPQQLMIAYKMHGNNDNAEIPLNQDSDCCKST